MIQICALDSIDNENLVFKNGDEKVLIPANEGELKYFSTQLKEDYPVLLEVELEEKRLIESYEQISKYQGELENPALIGSLDQEEI